MSAFLVCGALGGSALSAFLVGSTLSILSTGVWGGTAAVGLVLWFFCLLDDGRFGLIFLFLLLILRLLILAGSFIRRFFPFLGFILFDNLVFFGNGCLIARFVSLLLRSQLLFLGLLGCLFFVFQFIFLLLNDIFIFSLVLGTIQLTLSFSLGLFSFL